MDWRMSPQPFHDERMSYFVGMDKLLGKDSKQVSTETIAEA